MFLWHSCESQALGIKNKKVFTRFSEKITEIQKTTNPTTIKKKHLYMENRL